MSFRREKFVPKGGPDGGDGGRGGHVFIEGDPSLNTLLHLKYHTTWRAGRGTHGGSKNKTGGNAQDVTIPVPVGTEVWRLTVGGEKELVTDIVGPERVLVASGGAGGAGNSRFASATMQDPVLAERGEDGEEAMLLLELKLLADVGIIGRPNAGKSTLLSRCSAAKPKIDSYPFTTTEPVLGVVASRDESFVMMEVPGLIEGAQRGVGLGHEFLRHAERARLLLHLLDGLSEEPVEDWKSINNELVSFSPALARKPQVIVVNKIDQPEVRDQVSALTDKLGSAGATSVCFVSAIMGEGVGVLLDRVLQELHKLPRENVDTASRKSPSPVAREVAFDVTVSDGVYVVTGSRVERLIALANLKDSRAMVQLWAEMERMGIAKALERYDIKPGDTVRVGGVDLEWF